RAFKASSVATLSFVICQWRRAGRNKNLAAIHWQLFEGTFFLLPLGDFKLRTFNRPFELNLVLQIDDRLDHLLRTRRTAGNVDIDRNKAIDALHDGIVIEDAAG